MTIFGDLDVVERVIVSPTRELELVVHVKLSREGPSGRRIPADSYRRHKTSKFTDRPEACRMTVETSEFLVLRRWPGGKARPDEVYVSYPHLHRLRWALEAAASAAGEESSWADSPDGGVTPLNREWFAAGPVAGGREVALRLEPGGEGGTLPGAAIYAGPGSDWRCWMGMDALFCVEDVVKKLDLAAESGRLGIMAAVAGAAGAVPPPQPTEQVTVVAKRRPGA